MRMMILTVALTTGLIPISVAQDTLPQASLDRETSLQGRDRTGACSLPRQTSAPPPYCKPCLFYAGDFDSNASDANGLANEVDLIVSTGAAVYTPFVVPKGKTWTVTGLFTNNFLFALTIDPQVTPYEIRKGIPKAGGSGGKLVCHGTRPATLVDTGTCFPTYATIVKNIKGCRLPAGKYWMSVVPYCTNPNDSACANSWRSFLANDDGAMAHRFSPLEPANDSFFN